MANPCDGYAPTMAATRTTAIHHVCRQNSADQERKLLCLGQMRRINCRNGMICQTWNVNRSGPGNVDAASAASRTLCGMSLSSNSWCTTETAAGIVTASTEPLASACGVRVCQKGWGTRHTALSAPPSLTRDDCIISEMLRSSLLPNQTPTLASRYRWSHRLVQLFGCVCSSFDCGEGDGHSAQIAAG